MEPFTLDYLTKKESDQLDMDTSNKSQYEYELVGVLVHTSTDITIIKERKPAPGDPSTERRWYQFNDSNVELFDAKDIPKQCYGGPEQITKWDTNLQKCYSNISKTV
ncbi:6232_t:CDS:1 [Paraglomus brasilianum]|uniref:6232_t:CDS:1 n=1 Tax=Paraglomus brasilianum TaxID=144538 RepID=A0A9N9GNH1_9GLOM|nr:6232_t:CDS:1 [Paraglomus brasilianum]